MFIKCGETRTRIGGDPVSMVFSPLVREYRFTGDGEVYLPVQDEPIASPGRLQACVGVIIADESQSGRRLPHSKSWRVCEARSTLAKRFG
jgi:hypothetical protein